MARYMYGIRTSDGVPIRITNVPEDSYGIRCGCVCPDCGKVFEACSIRVENIREPHFRHYAEVKGGSNQDTTCTAEHANESALHLMAKKIIERERSVFMPELSILRSSLGLELPDAVLQKLPIAYTATNAKQVKGSSVELEVTYPGFRVDAVLWSDSGPVLIEILCSHRVNEFKREQVVQQGLPMLEIDIRSLVESSPTEEDLRDFLINESSNRQWIYHPATQEAKLQAKAWFLEHPVVQNYFKRQERASAAREMIKPTNYRKTVAQLSGGYNYFERIKHFHFYKETGKIPFFVNIPIKGEIVFHCDRRVWQGKIFDRWVYYRKKDSERGPSINTFNISACLEEDEGIVIHPAFKNKAPIWDDEEIYLPWEVVATYLRYLSNLGFIEFSEGKWAQVLKSHSIIPPNEEFAKHLSHAISVVDSGSVDVTRMIDGALKPYYLKQLQRQKDQEEKRRAENERIRAEMAERKRIEQERQKRLDKEQAEQARKDRIKKNLTNDLGIPANKVVDREQVSHADFSQDEYPIYDSNGLRWMKCEICGKVLPANQIGKYLSWNRGQCKVCRFRNR